MLNFNKWFKDTPKNVNDLTDIELIEAIANFMSEAEYKVYNLACKEIGITNQKIIDKSFEKFYFAMLKDRPCILLPEIREEFRRAYGMLSKELPK